MKLLRHSLVYFLRNSIEKSVFHGHSCAREFKTLTNSPAC
jgi:hypothetical protein